MSHWTEDQQRAFDAGVKQVQATYHAARGALPGTDCPAFLRAAEPAGAEVRVHLDILPMPGSEKGQCNIRALVGAFGQPKVEAPKAYPGAWYCTWAGPYGDYRALLWGSALSRAEKKRLGV